MEKKIEMVENFLTKKPRLDGAIPTLITVLLLVMGSHFYLNNLFDAEAWMPASAQTVFHLHHWWRAWTTLFAHGDFAHIFGNLFLFIPFAYFLTSTFGFSLFPLFGFFVGGLINLIVLTTMPEQTWLIGVSGVVYWMGACWITLAFLIDKREQLSRRIIKSLAITAILFVPETLRIEVSYLSHFLGTVFGFISGGLFYLINRSRIRAEDRYIIIPEAEESEELDGNQDENRFNSGDA